MEGDDGCIGEGTAQRPLPLHLKLPTHQGEGLADGLYNTVRDFLSLIWGLLSLPSSARIPLKRISFSKCAI